MFSRSQIKSKSGAVTLEEPGILPVVPTNIEAQISSNGVTLPVEPNLDIHQVELTCTDETGVITDGSVAFFAKGYSTNAEWQPIQKDGADYELDLSTGVRSFDVPNSSLTQIAAVPTLAVSVTAGTQWTLNIISGRK
jgi:hypothetical protein